MPKRSRTTKSTSEEKKKNPAAVALGKLRTEKSSPSERIQFASKGGHARAAQLSKERKSEIGRKAVLARWRREKQP